MHALLQEKQVKDGKGVSLLIIPHEQKIE